MIFGCRQTIHHARVAAYNFHRAPRRSNPRGTAIATEPLSETLVLPTRNSSLFHVIDPRVFERPLLDELCALATRARLLAKTDAGSRALRDLLPTRRAMLYFTQPSTRTFLSFNNACHILGMRTSEIRDPSTSSEVKGESFEDSIRTFSSYVDVIVMRTKESGRAAQAARLMNGIPRPVPVINAGSGSDQHPTQALLDIYTLAAQLRGHRRHRRQGHRHDGRPEARPHRALALLSDEELLRTCGSCSSRPSSSRWSPTSRRTSTSTRIPYTETSRLDDALPALDALYVTRMQTEWDTAGESRSVDLSRFSIGAQQLARLKRDAIIMHPLPRGAEIDPAVDQDPRAMYWRQERNGMWMRVAVLIKIFGAEDRIPEIDVV